VTLLTAAAFLAGLYVGATLLALLRRSGYQAGWEDRGNWVPPSEEVREWEARRS
jgi:hypothetical protein